MSNDIHTLLLKGTKTNFPKLHRIIKTNGILTIESKNESDLFVHLARTVTGQQLSKQAASTIWNRILNAATLHDTSLIEFSCERNTELLRKCGLSKNKVKAIVGLQKAFEDKTISLSNLTNSDHDCIVKEITKLWGFGTWSADMTALFFFGKPDVWSKEDAALKRGLKILSDNDQDKEKAILVATSPFKSYLSLHIWKAVDTKILY